MKSFFSLITLLILMLVFSGCGNKTESVSTSNFDYTSSATSSVTSSATSSQTSSATSSATSSILEDTQSANIVYGRSVYFLNNHFLDFENIDLFAAIGSLKTSHNYFSKFVAYADEAMGGQSVSGDSGDYYYTFPESDVLQEMRKTFVVSDDRFEELKQQKHFRTVGSYEIENVIYDNGNFVGTESCMNGYGGGGILKEIIIGYKYEKGILRIAIERFWRDYEDTEFIHDAYYEVEYLYSGNSKIWLENNAIVCTDKLLIDSLRIRTFKAITDVSSYTLKPNADKSTKIDFGHNLNDDTPVIPESSIKQNPTEYLHSLDAVNEQNKQIINKVIDTAFYYNKTIVGYTYKNGSLKICYEYKSIPDNNVLYIELEYTYSGSDKMIIDDNYFSYCTAIICKNQTQLLSLSLVSSKLVTDTSSYAQKPLRAAI